MMENLVFVFLQRAWLLGLVLEPLERHPLLPLRVPGKRTIKTAVFNANTGEKFSPI